MITPSAVSSATHSIGPFATTADKYSVTGSGGPDFGTSTANGVCFELTALAGIQSPWSYSTAASGWALAVDGVGTLSLTIAPATVYIIATALPPGVHAVIVTNVAGALRASIDGAAAIQLTAAVTYVAGTVLAQNVIGNVNTLFANDPATNMNIFWNAHLSQAVSDANLQAWSNQVNLTERTNVPPGILALSATTLVSAYHADDGAGATITASHGTGPYTWTKAGTVVQNAFGPFNTYTLNDSAFFNGGLHVTTNYQTGVYSGSTYTMRNQGASVVFTCANPSRMVIDVANDTFNFNGVAPNVALRIGGVPGVSLGTPVKNGVNCNAQQATFTGQLRAVDWEPGTFPAGTTLEIICGQCAIPGGSLNIPPADLTIRGTSIQAVRVPASTPITFFFCPTAPVDRVVCWTDSIGGGFGTSAGNTGSWTGLLHANIGGGKHAVIANPVGSLAGFNLYGDAGKITATLDQVAQFFDGSGTDTLWLGVGGLNDWEFAYWTAAQLQTGLQAFATAFHVRFPGKTLYLQSFVTWNGTPVVNAVGDLPNAYATAILAVATANPGFCVGVPGTTMMPLLSMLQTNGHLLQSGSSFCAQFATKTLGYAKVFPWLTNAVYDGALTTNAWVADAAYTGGGATVATWTPQKGATNYAANTAPTWALDYGTALLGSCTFNGTTQSMEADALAALVTGTNVPYRITYSLTVVTVATKVIGGFAHSTTASQGFHDFLINATHLQTARAGDSGASKGSISAEVVTTANVVFSLRYDGTLGYTKIDGGPLTPASANQSTVAATFNRFTIAALNNGGVLNSFLNCKIRGISFSTVGNDDTSMEIDEGFWAWEKLAA